MVGGFGPTRTPESRSDREEEIDRDHMYYVWKRHLIK